MSREALNPLSQSQPQCKYSSFESIRDNYHNQMQLFETINLYRNKLFKYNENIRLNQEARGIQVVSADLRKLGEDYTFENKVVMQIEISKIVDKIDEYYQSLITNINS